MNKKKLPKAVLLTADDLREAGAKQRQDARRPTDWDDARAAEADAPSASSNVIEMTPKPDNDQTAIATPELSLQAAAAAARRRRKAIAIVERHANMSTLGGILPVPILNVAAITAVMVRMVRQLSHLYGVPFQRNRAHALVIGLMGGVMPTGLASAATSALVYVVPGANVLGLVVSSVTAGACARSIGRLFIDHFESGATLVDFPSKILR
jgi:uncharacterized protein (DUF697 family)